MVMISPAPTPSTSIIHPAPPAALLAHQTPPVATPAQQPSLPGQMSPPPQYSSIDLPAGVAYSHFSAMPPPPPPPYSKDYPKMQVMEHYINGHPVTIYRLPGVDPRQQIELDERPPHYICLAIFVMLLNLPMGLLAFMFSFTSIMVAERNRAKLWGQVSLVVSICGIASFILLVLVVLPAYYKVKFVSNHPLAMGAGTP